VQSRASQLLQSLDPLEDLPDVRRRVWLSLSQEPQRIRRTRRLARPAFAAVSVVFLSAAVAGASVGRGWLARVVATFGALSEPASAPAEPRAARAPERAAHRRPEPIEAPVGLVAPKTEVSATPAARESVPARSRSARSATASPRVDAPKRSNFGAEAFATAPREEASLVLAAMAALRRDHDAARSTQLLATYLRQYPKGVLREEALALQMEAASSLRDPQLGARSAQGYLQTHPNGRFRELAKSTLDRAATPETKPEASGGLKK
jgi:hypothetical protein